MIRVMIVEDQKLVRSLLESYIQNEDGYQLAVSIPGAAEAPILCDTEDIDLVLMDVQTEHRENGLAAAKKIREAHPAIKMWWRPRLLTHRSWHAQRPWCGQPVV
ncbi:MAG: response regulator [Gemmiger formicilis]|uniref:response regulator n=1 Tax=Gemmiger formicilis TaxID=745368 RepID=UPI003A4A419D